MKRYENIYTSHCMKDGKDFFYHEIVDEDGLAEKRRAQLRSSAFTNWVWKHFSATMVWAMTEEQKREKEEEFLNEQDYFFNYQWRELAD